jgi:tetratricopeptide (TPR) repeat protein
MKTVGVTRSPSISLRMGDDEPSRLDVFFAAQDAASAGREDEADELYAFAAQAPSDVDEPSDDGPPASLVKSMAHNGRAELALDRALVAGFPLKSCPTEVDAAIQSLQLALLAHSANSTALMNRALLARDVGDPELALQLWAQVVSSDSRGSGGRDSGGDDSEWREDWLLAPQRRSAPLAITYRALLLSQLGRHEEALAPLRRLGYRWRLAPPVWDCARTGVGCGDPGGSDGDDDSAYDASSQFVRLTDSAVSLGTYTALCRAFAPGAAYWRQTGYETASASKRYFTFYVDLSELLDRGGQAPSETRPTSAIERLLLQLLPLTGRASELKSCEWWVHRRAAGRNVGHEMHFDCEEQTMETSGHVVHPAVSSVVYLSGCGDPTIVLDETLATPLGATRAYLAHPRARRFLAFRGDLLHGVLPGAFNAMPMRSSSSSSAAAAAAAAQSGGASEPEQRLTLLVAWYSERTVGGARRSRLGAQSTQPRRSRSTTWPADLELTESEYELDSSRLNGDPPCCVHVPYATPAWEALEAEGQQQPAVTSGSGESDVPLMAPPPSMRQHFFLHRAGEVGERLFAEHGIEGSWVPPRTRATATSATHRKKPARASASASTADESMLCKRPRRRSDKP